MKGTIVIDDFTTVTKVEVALTAMSAKEQVQELVAIVHSGELKNLEVFNFCFSRLSEISEDEVIISLSSLLELKSSHHQDVRDLVSNLLGNLSSEHLADNLPLLINSLRSRFTLERMEAEILLNKIQPLLLVKHFDFLRLLFNENNFDLKRVSRSLISKIIKVWTLEEKVKHYDYATELQSSCELEIVESGNLLALQVISTWPKDDKRLFDLLPFFKNCSKKGSAETSELAALLALDFYKQATYSELLLDIDYLTSFNTSGNKILRRGYRHLALMTLSMIDEDYLAKFAKFFLQCLEGKNVDDRTSAWKLLLQIDPNLLPVSDLVNCQVCGLYRVRRAGRKLAKRVNEETLLANLEFFLNAQHSSNRDVRDMASRLATSISIGKLKTKRDLLESRVNSKNVFELDLARCLLFLV